MQWCEYGNDFFFKISSSRSTNDIENTKTDGAEIWWLNVHQNKVQAAMGGARPLYKNDAMNDT